MLKINNCIYEDCESTDIVEVNGGVQTLMATMYKGRSYNGNLTARIFKCNACGEAFSVYVKVFPLCPTLIWEEPEINANFDFFEHRVSEEEKEKGAHLP